MKNEFDIAIVGGGPVGASLACCLASSGYRIAVLEKIPVNADQQPSYDDRGLALSLSSCRILKAAGIWQEIKESCVPIKKIHVSDRGNFGIVRLDANELGVDAMGYVVIARTLGRALIKRLQSAPDIDFINPAEVNRLSADSKGISLSMENGNAVQEILCKLVVGADGSHSRVKAMAGLQAEIKDYHQTAIVSNISTDISDGDTAYERFTPQGPLALLPLGESDFVSILCVDNKTYQQYMEMTDDMYISQLQEVAGKRIGNITMSGSRHAYPLQLLKADPSFCDRIVMLGNAAHSIHPNGAQGFNLGLRDTACLAELLIKNRRLPGFDPGAKSILEQYQSIRKHDQDRVIGFSDGLTEIFYSQNPVKKVFRNSAMTLLNVMPGLKRKFAMLAMGLDGNQPSLVRGLQLDQL
ncbi:MAG: 2-octaprenyl-6-methoxyphenyl hydroxylase [Gammaproteobacteria bacterium]|nr:2-octaprenyl-6-methoxyphenyl hydroxylase [Gammaproteobacteria bacterium]